MIYSLIFSIIFLSTPKTVKPDKCFLNKKLLKSSKKCPPLSQVYEKIYKKSKSKTPIVTITYVALCSNKIIWCGNKNLGLGNNLRKNLYWASSDSIHYLLGKKGWKKVADFNPKSGDIIKIILHRKKIKKSGYWKKINIDSNTYIYHVSIAYKGVKIKNATLAFGKTSTHGKLPKVITTFLKIHLPKTFKGKVDGVGYIGHNYLMDKPSLLKKFKSGKSNSFIWVFACISYKYFKKFIKKTKVIPVLLTKTLIYPGGFLVKAILDGLINGWSQKVMAKKAAKAMKYNQRRNKLSYYSARKMIWP
jgi:hypothetical protein